MRWYQLLVLGLPALAGCGDDTAGPSHAGQVATVEVSAQRDTLALSDTVTLQAVARSAKGDVLPGLAVTWASGDSSIAAISATGVVTALAAGEVTLAATIGGVRDTVVLTIRALQFSTLAAGADVSCGLLADGQAWCWGRDNAGQLGQGAVEGTESHPVPRPVATPLRFSALALGGSDACGLVTDGTVACWGANAEGTAGNGATGPVAAPALVPGLGGVVTLAHMVDHVCALTGSQQLYCWGANRLGQVGDGTRTDRLAPVQVAGAPALVELSGTRYVGCGRTAAGATWCWGNNGRGELGIDTIYYRTAPGAVPGGAGAQQLSANLYHTCRLTAAGDAECWGYTWFNEGRSLDLIPTVQGAGHVWTSVVAGEEHACALLASGAAWCWGNDDTGQLGDGTISPTSDPQLPTAVAGGHAFTQLVAGRNFTCGLTAAGAVWCWGTGLQGELGDSLQASSPVPVALAGGLSFTRLSAGRSHACGISATNEAWCWGSNSHGQLGGGASAPVVAPRLVPGGGSFAMVAGGGGGMSCGISSAGVLSCWGSTPVGLGDGSTTDSPVPVPVAGGLTFTAVTVGDGHACGIATGGQAWCWGANRRGELGDGSTTARTIPTAVGGAGGYTAIAAGWTHTCALTSTGATECWGGNDIGQLGDGVHTDSPVPLPGAGGASFTELAIGFDQCGRTSAREVYCWPTAVAGEPQPSVHLVPGGVTFASLAMGGTMACGVDAAGAGWCWGRNQSGQLGTGAVGTGPASSTPAPVTGGLQFARIAAGDAHACGLTTDGVAYCWGNGFSGALGDPATPLGLTPYPVKVAGQP